MSLENITSLKQGLKTAFLDKNVSSDLGFKPQFISNNYKEGRKVLSSIEEELLNCDEFIISVAFITMGGIVPLLQTFRELEKNNIKGKILTTNYLSFSEPKALKKLSEFKNIEIKMFEASNSIEGFHTKGYIFKKEDIFKIIVGSSNLTSTALTTNREWNTKIVSTKDGEYVHGLLSEFNNLWNAENTKFISEIIKDYEKEYFNNKKLRERLTQIADEEDIVETFTLKPNSMQVGFIKNLRSIFESGEDKALLISATGTGKTYASAFAMRDLGFKRVLFIVHRIEIAMQAKKTFERVFEGKVKCGLVSGGHSDFDADFVFGIINTISKDEVLDKYNKKHFDAIIIDEAHHSSADSYKKVLNHFSPLLWLGMTATPDKRDDSLEGRNIYEIFNHNIAYEIRLQDAMEEDLLCPFHYFGITELEVITSSQKKKEDLILFKKLISLDRVNHIMEQARFFGYSGERVKGLIFCSRTKEAEELSKLFNERGWRTLDLSGANSPKEREEAIKRLTGPDRDDALDYIISVDIFSEGVDVPEINQVIMLRPTQSPIVFVQQLGRGLRKAKNKEYVVVLDFIGNYDNNYMIPIALSGDRTYNKDNIRRYVSEGGRIIPGESTIHFDEISRKKIFDAIDKANFSASELIKKNYFNLKNKLGRIPLLSDFDKYGEMDVLRIFDSKTYGSYYDFLVKVEKDNYKTRLSEAEREVIRFVSKKLASGKRVHELILLKFLLDYEKETLELMEESLKRDYGISVDENCLENLVNIMTNEFQAENIQEKMKDCVFLERRDNEFIRASSFDKMLHNQEFCKMLEELLNFGISRYERDFSEHYKETNLVLYQKYTYEDVCRLLNWEKNLSSVMFGYRYDQKTNTYPVFINYDKAKDITDTTMYEDRFTNPSHLIAISKSKKNMRSEDVQRFLRSSELNTDVELFVRKNKDGETNEFYYLGRMKPTGYAKEFTMTKNATAVEIEWELDVPVRDDIYEYITLVDKEK